MRYLIKLLVLSCTPLLAANRSEAPKLLEGQPYVLGPAMVQTMAEGTYFYLTCQTSQLEIASRMEQLVPKLRLAMAMEKLMPSGPMISIYRGMERDPAALFQMEIGFLVPKGTKPAGEAKVHPLEAFHCASLIYTGPITQVGKSYETLFPALLGGGKVPNQELRQMTLHWENPQSPNNVICIQVGIR